MGRSDRLIEGVSLHPLKQVHDSRGKVMHMLRRDSPFFSTFGEVYFSVINEGVVKAWKRHFEMTQNLAVPVGRIRLVIFDDRESSSTRGEINEIFVSQDDYKLVAVPPHLWYGFEGLGAGFSLIANVTNIPFRESEVERCSSDANEIPFRWR